MTGRTPIQMAITALEIVDLRRRRASPAEINGHFDRFTDRQLIAFVMQTLAQELEDGRA